MRDDPGWEASRRRVYLGALGVSVPTIPVVVWLRWATEPFLGAVYGVLLVLLIGTFLGLATRRLSTVAAETVVIIAVPTVMMVRLFLLLYRQPDLGIAADVVNQSIGPVLTIVSIIAFLALDARRAAWIAGSYVVVGMVLVLPRVIGEMVAAGPTTHVIGLLRVGVTTGVSVALLFALAGLKEHLAREQARSEVNAELARTDVLTGLRNRRAALERLAELSALAQRYERPLSLVLVDLDHFKRINDEAGHLEGDRVLCEVADTIADRLRTADVLARWGGDELLLLLPETTAGAAGATMERIVDRVREGIRVEVVGADGVTVPLVATLSVGVAQQAPGDDADDLIARADRALYRAKALGRDRVVVAGPASSGAAALAGSPV